MSMEPKSFAYYTKLEGDDFSPPVSQIAKQIEAGMSAYKFKAAKIIVEEIVHWDIAKMRGFLHAKIIPVFTQRFADAYQHPTGGKFTKKLTKTFLKARFLGYIKNAAYREWAHTLRLEDRTMDILDFIRLQNLMENIVNPPEICHTEKLTALEYWNFLDQCDKYFFELFHDAIDKREMPPKPTDN